jgi:hypothetical protein
MYQKYLYNYYFSINNVKLFAQLQIFCQPRTQVILLPVSENGPGIGRSHDLKISSVWGVNNDNLCVKFLYKIIIYILITDRSKHTQCCRIL